jgi:hypothetical protein
MLLLVGCEQAVTNKHSADSKSSAVIQPKNLNVTKDNEQDVKAEQVLATEKSTEVITYQEIEWIELMPETDLEALLNPPEYILAVEEGTAEDSLDSIKTREMDNGSVGQSDYEKALISTDIIEGMDGKHIEIPGYIVPVSFDDAQIVTSFFLVPYFGACLHMPPPPPNQIIYITIEDGFKLEDFYEPVIVSGKLSVSLFEDAIASSAYTMTMDKMRFYYDSE